jgi:hypothetical protein
LLVSESLKKKRIKKISSRKPIDRENGLELKCAFCIKLRTS